MFIASGQAGEVLATARQIAQTERDQARKIQAGQTLRQQTNFGEYLTRRAAEPSYTFRRHLRQTGGAIEELAKPDQYRKLPSLRRWRRLRPERSSREARRQAAAASGHETKGPAGAAAACGSSVTRGQPTRCYIGAHPTAPMPHRVGTGQHRAGAGR